MNKQDLIKIVAKDVELTQKQADAAVSCVLASIMNAVADGEKVKLVGFGAFEARRREGRMGVNPRTKEKIQLKAAVLPVFKAGRLFKDAVNK